MGRLLSMGYIPSPSVWEKVAEGRMRAGRIPRDRDSGDLELAATWCGCCPHPELRSDLSRRERFGGRRPERPVALELERMCSDVVCCYFDAANSNPGSEFNVRIGLAAPAKGPNH